MIVRHQNNVAAFAGGHVYYFLPQQSIAAYVSVTSAVAVTAGFICVRDGEIKTARSDGEIKIARSTGTIVVPHSIGTIRGC